MGSLDELRRYLSEFCCAEAVLEYAEGLHGQRKTPHQRLRSIRNHEEVLSRAAPISAPGATLLAPDERLVVFASGKYFVASNGELYPGRASLTFVAGIRIPVGR